MAKEIFLETRRRLRKESLRRTHRADQTGSRALAKALEAGGTEHPGEFLDRQEVHGGQQPLPDEPGDPRGPRR